MFVLLLHGPFLGIIRASAPIRNVRRTGTSATVQVEVESPGLPKYAYVGPLRHKIFMLVDRPLQCRRCENFGHVHGV